MIRYLGTAFATGMLCALTACGGGEHETGDEVDAMPDETATLQPAAEPETPAARQATLPVGDVGPDPEMLSGELTGGEWFYKEEGPMALFGPPNTEALFGLRCVAGDREVVIQRSGTLPEENSLAEIALYTNEGNRQYIAQASDGPLPMLEAHLTAQDMFLDDLAHADRLTVTVTGGEPLKMPGDAAIGRLVKGCRTASML